MNTESVRNFLIEHSRSKKNGVFPRSTNLETKLTNPICGDHVELKLRVKNSIVEEIGHRAQACAICAASASLLCEEIAGQNVQNIISLAEIFERGVTQEESEAWPAEISAFVCFQHLRINPSRRMCALLPWVALKSALLRSDESTL